jgi:hypothetical protein
MTIKQEFAPITIVLEHKDDLDLLKNTIYRVLDSSSLFRTSGKYDKQSSEYQKLRYILDRLER